MSNAVTNLCRPIALTSTRKCVLMALADRADEEGVAWPSVAWLAEWTCFSRTAVIDAVKWLQDAGIVRITKAAGRNNRCEIDLEKVAALIANQYARTTTTSSPGVLVEKARDTGDQSPRATNQSPTATGSAGGLVVQGDHRPSPTATTGSSPGLPTSSPGLPDTSNTSNKTPDIHPEEEAGEAGQQAGLEGIESPVVAELPLETGELHPVTQAEVDHWAPAYPSLDLSLELKRMRMWLDADVTRRKTKRGINKFIVGWLGRQPALVAGSNRAARPLSRHTGFDQRNYEGEPDGSIPA
jgi:Fe2+ or Zn2+ uptake regulation protein